MVTGPDLERVSWLYVHFVSTDVAEQAKRELAGTDALVIDIDGSVIQTRDHLFGEFVRAMRFPYFGWNWDAFDDCMRDLEWLRANSYVVFVSHAEQLWARVPREAGALVESWLFVANRWAQAEVPFHLVFVW